MIWSLPWTERPASCLRIYTSDISPRLCCIAQAHDHYPLKYQVAKQLPCHVLQLSFSTELYIQNTCYNIRQGVGSTQNLYNNTQECYKPQYIYSSADIQYNSEALNNMTRFFTLQGFSFSYLWLFENKWACLRCYWTRVIAKYLHDSQALPQRELLFLGSQRLQHPKRSEGVTQGLKNPKNGREVSLPSRQGH